jgi:antigen flippase
MQAVIRGQGTGHSMFRTIGVQALIVLLNVSTGVLTGRLLGPDGRGIYAAVILWPQLIATVAAGGLPYALLYYGHDADGPAARSVVGTTLLLGAITGIIGAAAGAALVPYFMGGHYPAAALLFAQVSTLVAVVNLMVILARQALVARGRLNDYNTAAWLDPALCLALLVVVCLSGPLSPEGAALCLYVAGLLGLLWLVWRLCRVSPPSFRGFDVWLPRIASYAARASGFGMLSSLSVYLDRLVLVFALPPRALGLYAAAFSLSRLANVVQNALGVVVLPAMAGAHPDDAKMLHDRAFRLVLLAMLLGGTAAAWLGEPTLVALYGSGFADAKPILLVLIGDAALSCLCQVVLQLFLALGRPGYPSWAQGAGFAVTVLGLLGLVPGFGAVGAAWAVASGSVVRLAVLLGGVRWLLRLPLPRLLCIGDDLVALVRGAAA